MISAEPCGLACRRARFWPLDGQRPTQIRPCNRSADPRHAQVCNCAPRGRHAGRARNPSIRRTCRRMVSGLSRTCHLARGAMPLSCPTARLGQIMSRELGCLTHRSCNALNVVPAKAGTHNHRRLSLKDGGTTSPVHYTGRGVWIPAFAGTTPGRSSGISAQAQASLGYWITRMRG